MLTLICIDIFHCPRNVSKVWFKWTIWMIWMIGDKSRSGQHTWWLKKAQRWFIVACKEFSGSEFADSRSRIGLQYFLTFYHTNVTTYCANSHFGVEVWTRLCFSGIFHRVLGVRVKNVLFKILSLSQHSNLCSHILMLFVHARCSHKRVQGTQQTPNKNSLISTHIKYYMA